jgi:hypothetical protein
LTHWLRRFTLFLGQTKTFPTLDLPELLMSGGGGTAVEGPWHSSDALQGTDGGSLKNPPSTRAS